MTDETKLILVDQIEPLIHEIRGQKVMLDRDLAALYGVPTKRLNEQVQRNIARFPDDILFRLTTEEAKSLRSQIATSKISRGGRRYLPFAFTEHGAYMAASLLNSPRAVEISVFVVRAFAKLRQLVLAHKDLAGKLDQLERKVGGHDEAIKQLVAAIRRLMAPAPSPSKNQLAFTRSASPPSRSPSHPSHPSQPPSCGHRNAEAAPMSTSRPASSRTASCLRSERNTQSSRSNGSPSWVQAPKIPRS